MTSKCEHRSGFCHLDHIKLRPAAHICNRMFNFQICFSASDNLTYIRRKSHHMAVQSNPSSNAKFVKTKKVFQTKHPKLPSVRKNWWKISWKWKKRFFPNLVWNFQYWHMWNQIEWNWKWNWNVKSSTLCVWNIFSDYQDLFQKLMQSAAISWIRVQKFITSVKRKHFHEHSSAKRD